MRTQMLIRQMRKSLDNYERNGEIDNINDIMMMCRFLTQKEDMKKARLERRAKEKKLQSL